MPDCGNRVGPRRIIISLKDCDTESEWRNVEHQANGDTLPTVLACNQTRTILPGGKVQVGTGTGYSFTIEIIRVDGIPLAMYQGCAVIDVSVEWYDGTVWTLLNGDVTDAAESDGNSVQITASFKTFHEDMGASFLATDEPIQLVA